MTLDPAPVARSVRFTVRDGLQLHARCYEAPGSTRPPVVCLAGLTRNSRDFHDVALALSTGPEARTVWALDSRGRGLSDSDPNWQNYTVPYETQDVIDFIAMAEVHGATVIGTSRGGLVAMVLAAVQPAAIGAVVLNDIGPVIERTGLERIAGYVGQVGLPSSWKDAGALVAEMSRKQFPDITAEQWEEVARAWFNDTDGRPAPGYDPAIARTFTDSKAPIPELWPQFMALSHVPVLVLRGEYSDILGTGTMDEMLRRHPRCSGVTIPRQGHAPLLMDPFSIDAIARFILAAEDGRGAAANVLAATGNAAGNLIP